MNKKVLSMLVLLLFLPAIVMAEDLVESKPYTDLTEWLYNLGNSQKSIDADKSSKTATIVNEEEHIYRIDINTQSDLHTFEGPIDLGFMLDVSNSMLFPSYLEKEIEDFPIYLVNPGAQYYYYQPYSRFLDPEKEYYLIGDPTFSATIFKIYYKPIYGGIWYAVDASKDAVEGNTFRIGLDLFKMFYNDSETLYPFSAGDTIFKTYDLYVVGKYKDDDTPETRLDSLQYSMTRTRTALVDILDKSSLAKQANLNPDVRIAYNTFNKLVDQYHPNFISVRDPASANIIYNTSGGTHTDYALGHPDQEPDSIFFGSDRSAATFNWRMNNMNYGILFTDGIPQAGSESISYDKVLSAAQRLKSQYNVKLITVGLGLGSVPNGRKILSDIASRDYTGRPMFYASDNGTELTSLFLQAIKDIMFSPISYSNVTDVISEDFYPVDSETGVPLKADDRINLAGKLVDNNYGGFSGKIVFKNNKYQVEWRNQFVPISGWHGTVYIKAKDTVYGENIPTNYGSATIECNHYSINGAQIIELKDEYKAVVELASPTITIINEKETTEKMDLSDSKQINEIFPEVESVFGVNLIIRDESIVKIEDGKIIPLAIGSTDVEFIKGATKYTIHVLVTHVEPDPIPEQPKENPNTGTKYLIWILSIMIISGALSVLYWQKTQTIKKEVK